MWLRPERWPGNDGGLGRRVKGCSGSHLRLNRVVRRGRGAVCAPPQAIPRVNGRRRKPSLPQELSVNRGQRRERASSAPQPNRVAETTSRCPPAATPMEGPPAAPKWVRQFLSSSCHARSSSLATAPTLASANHRAATLLVTHAAHPRVRNGPARSGVSRTRSCLLQNLQLPVEVRVYDQGFKVDNSPKVDTTQDQTQGNCKSQFLEFQGQLYWSRPLKYPLLEEKWIFQDET